MFLDISLPQKLIVKIYAHILQCIQTNQSKGENLINCDYHLIKYFELKVTIFSLRFPTMDRQIRMYFIVYYIVFAIIYNGQWFKILNYCFTLQYIIKQSFLFDRTRLSNVNRYWYEYSLPINVNNPIDFMTQWLTRLSSKWDPLGQEFFILQFLLASYALQMDKSNADEINDCIHLTSILF